MPYDYPPAHTAVPAVRPVNLRRTKPVNVPKPEPVAAARFSQPDQKLNLTRHVLQGTKKVEP